MLGHTMIERDSAEPNYILFYNIKRGILKGFYYNPNDIGNNGFLWVMESDKPTSIFPSNSIAQFHYKQNSYLTTSNIVESSKFEFGHLNGGWNAFSFELIYSTLNGGNENPIVKIYGYNNQQSTISLGGTYSGEVIIPVPKEDESGLSSIFSGLENIAKLVGLVVPKAKTVAEAIKYTGSALGSASSYKSESSTYNIKATSSGKIDLTGSSFTNLGGVIRSINNVSLKRINGGNDLGLWNLKEMPIVKYNKYNKGEINYTERDRYYVFAGYADLFPAKNVRDLVIINPQIWDQIEEYDVSYRFISSSGYRVDKLSDGVYKYAAVVGYPPFYPPNLRFKQAHFYEVVHPFSPMMNVTVEFKYKDGSTFISSRNYEIAPIEIDNIDYVTMHQETGNSIYIWKERDLSPFY